MTDWPESGFLFYWPKTGFVFHSSIKLRSVKSLENSKKNMGIKGWGWLVQQYYHPQPLSQKIRCPQLSLPMLRHAPGSSPSTTPREPLPSLQLRILSRGGRPTSSSSSNEGNQELPIFRATASSLRTVGSQLSVASPPRPTGNQDVDPMSRPATIVARRRAALMGLGNKENNPPLENATI